MARKIIIDCDPGIDDAIALCIALLEPDFDVLAVTATEGNATAEQTTRNVQAIVENLDPPRFPRVGSATPNSAQRPANLLRFHGPDGLGGCGPEGCALHHAHPSDKLICDIIRSAPEQVTVISLGPMTNLARAFRRDPEIRALIGRLIIMAGTVNGVGNVTPAAEFNVHFDPDSAREVFQSPTTKTLIPLDVTRRLVFSVDLMNHIPPRTTRLGEFLHRMLAYTFRAHRQALGIEGIQIHDAVAMIAAIQPELIVTQEMAADVETRGELTLGSTVFDRRPFTRVRPNMEVAVDINEQAAMESVLRALRRTGQR